MYSEDPLGKAIQHYAINGECSPIQVESDLMDNDIIPVEYLFRSYDMMPEIEQIALSRSNGKILDVGACAGAHTTWLRNRGLDVTAIDTSKGAIDYLDDQFPNHINKHIGVLDLKQNSEKFDTILLLMNGIGLAGDLNSLSDFLVHLKGLLSEKGKIICDSTDVKYFYQEDDGGMWVDLNTEYYGNFKFKMKFDNVSTDWFPWLYVDHETLESKAVEAGLDMKVLISDDHSYLAEITVKK